MDKASVDAQAEDAPTERELFHKLLPGIINARTDGAKVHAATRVQNGYWWVIFHPLQPADRSLQDV